MKLVMVVERPTQFEIPLFRHAARDPAHQLSVLYTAPDAGAAAHDPELGRPVRWEEDALTGHEQAVAPRAGAREWLRRQLAPRCDLVVVNGYTRRPYLTAIAAARQAGSPVGLRIDSVAFDAGGTLRRLLKRALVGQLLRRVFDRFFAVGTLTRDLLRSQGVPAAQIARLPYPVDATRLADAARRAERSALRQSWGLPAAAPAVLAIAKLHPRETPWELLQAWPEVAGEERWLLLVGDGPERSAVERFVIARALPRVRLLGYLPYRELPACYAATDLFVHAPREERWGVSIGEALACGRPVVASSRVGAAHDLVVDGQNGFRYPAGDRPALVRAIAAALRLAPDAVERHSQRLLAEWGPEATWRGMVEAAAELAERRR